MSDFGSFATLVTTLEPWLDRVVFVGGWAHRLHRMHALARDPGHEALLTLDADVVLPSDASLETSDIRARLEKEFAPEYSGDNTPPVTYYRPKKDAGGFYAEFLMPLVGSEYKRGRLDATGNVGGIAATKLRYLELLTISPWTINLGGVGADSTRAVHVRVPNAAAFIAHKLLVLERRKREDQAKDVLYIHDTIELFADSLDDLNNLWKLDLRPELPKKVSAVVESAADRFATVTDLLRRASLVAPERSLAPEALAQTIRAGLRQLLH